MSAVAVIAALAISACGSSNSEPTEKTPPDNLVSQAELNKGPEDGVEHAFVSYWSALQYESWAEVATFYDPEFRRQIGTATIIGAKRLDAGSYPELKPEVSRVSSRGGLVTISYQLQFLDGTREFASIAWRKEGGNWGIVFDSRLDAELDQFAENKVELAQSGVLPTEIDEVSPAAKRAGAAAAQAQARFLQGQLLVSG